MKNIYTFLVCFVLDNSVSSSNSKDYTLCIKVERDIDILLVILRYVE